MDKLNVNIKLVDKITDCIPLVSTFKNFGIIYYKTAHKADEAATKINLKTHPSIKNDFKIQALEKSRLAAGVASIPVLGNIAILLHYVFTAITEKKDHSSSNQDISPFETDHPINEPDQSNGEKETASTEYSILEESVATQLKGKTLDECIEIFNKSKGQDARDMFEVILEKGVLDFNGYDPDDFSEVFVKLLNEFNPPWGYSQDLVFQQLAEGMGWDQMIEIFKDKKAISDEFKQNNFSELYQLFIEKFPKETQNNAHEFFLDALTTKNYVIADAMQISIQAAGTDLYSIAYYEANKAKVSENSDVEYDAELFKKGEQLANSELKSIIYTGFTDLSSNELTTAVADTFAKAGNAKEFGNMLKEYVTANYPSNRFSTIWSFTPAA